LTLAAARAASDKAAQRAAFASAGLDVPGWREPASAEDAVAAVRVWGRAVIKPVDRASGAAVRLATTADEARDAFEEARRASPHGRVLAEEFLDGPEVSVESVAIDGRQRAVCVTDKETTPGPRFLELGHTVPSALAAPVRDRVVGEAERACASLDLTAGAAHTEVKLVRGKPVVLEVNARPAGDCIVDLVAHALGVDLYELVARDALGERLREDDLAPRGASGAAIRFRLGRAGRLRSATASPPPPGVVERAVTAPVGSALREPTSNGGRVAYAIALGSTPAEAGARADAALGELALEIVA
jgi:biotin carboxylase